MQQLDQAPRDADQASCGAVGTQHSNELRSGASPGVAPALKDFLNTDPDSKIDIMSDHGLINIADKGYDAGT